MAEAARLGNGLDDPVAERDGPQRRRRRRERADLKAELLLNRNAAGNQWRSERKAAGLADQYTLHDLRHTRQNRPY
ncbi:hypothetical protein [Sinomonas sp. P10A9]|uniref:Integrase n=1 Tax=Sinomonas puerhi TaxID=3238584 RepID=A0AB39L0G2_9MICC